MSYVVHPSAVAALCRTDTIAVLHTRQSATVYLGAGYPRDSGSGDACPGLWFSRNPGLPRLGCTRAPHALTMPRPTAMPGFLGARFVPQAAENLRCPIGPPLIGPRAHPGNKTRRWKPSNPTRSPREGPICRKSEVFDRYLSNVSVCPKHSWDANHIASHRPGTGRLLDGPGPLARGHAVDRGAAVPRPSSWLCFGS